MLKLKCSSTSIKGWIFCSGIVYDHIYFSVFARSTRLYFMSGKYFYELEEGYLSFIRIFVLKCQSLSLLYGFCGTYVELNPYLGWIRSVSYIQ
jgi:hypothetical protein